MLAELPDVANTLLGLCILDVPGRYDSASESIPMSLTRDAKAVLSWWHVSLLQDYHHGCLTLSLQMCCHDVYIWLLRRNSGVMLQAIAVTFALSWLLKLMAASVL